MFVSQPSENARRLKSTHPVVPVPRIARLAFFRPNFIGLVSSWWALKILVDVLAFLWLHLKLVGLKKFVWSFGSFLAFFR